MNKFKYRAWDKVNKEMCNVTGLHFFEGTELTQISLDTKNGEKQYLSYLDNYIIMPYTGRNDKNKIEIFEDDIVKYYSYSFIMKKNLEFIALIRWSHTESMFLVIDYQKERAVSFQHASLRNCEIIGNRHENPELVFGY